MDIIRVLFIGDVVGQPGRKILKKNIAKLKEDVNAYQDITSLSTEAMAGIFEIKNHLDEWDTPKK